MSCDLALHFGIDCLERQRLLIEVIGTSTVDSRVWFVSGTAKNDIVSCQGCGYTVRRSKEAKHSDGWNGKQPHELWSLSHSGPGLNVCAGACFFREREVECMVQKVVVAKPAVGYHDCGMSP